MVLCAVATGLLAPAEASAAVTSVFGGQTVSGAAIPCAAQSDGTQVCHGTYNNGTGGTDLRLKSFDGQPLALYLTLPPCEPPTASSQSPCQTCSFACPCMKRRAPPPA